MSEKHQLDLTQDDGPKSDGFFKNLIDDVGTAAKKAVKASGEYAEAMGEEQSEKAKQIRQDTSIEAGRFEMDKEQMIYERDQREKESERRHEEEMAKIENDRIRAQADAFKGVAEAVKTLKDAGYDIALEQVSGMLTGDVKETKRLDDDDMLELDGQATGS